MSLGWGLRGSIGGGPMGALIPGAMVALALAALRGEPMGFALRAAAISAVAVSFGGDMTYGQTIGLLKGPDTFWWGLLGLTVKGAVWGLLAGPLVWMAFHREMPRPAWLAPGLVLLVAGAFLGWKLVNEPKLIYFSNALDKPRVEIWCGLLFAGVLLAAWLWRVTGSVGALRAALLGFLSGGFGFGAGSLLMLLVNSLTKDADGWKAMELFFGFCFGVGLAFAVPPEAREGPEESGGHSLFLLSGLALAGVVVLSEEFGGLRYMWAITGSLLLLLLPYIGQLWRGGALALPILPALIDAVEGKQQNTALTGIVLFIGVAFLLAAARVRTAANALHLLAITGTALALLKFIPAGGSAHHVAIAFVTMTGVLLWKIRAARPA